MQLLFCLFAEDVRLLPNAVFSKMVAAGVRHPDRFTAHAAELLTVMNTGGSVAYEDIPRFNGGLFATVDVPGLTDEDIRILHEAAALDWSAIEPSIFGTLFERSLDPGKRSQLGALHRPSGYRTGGRPGGDGAITPALGSSQGRPGTVDRPPERRHHAADAAQPGGGGCGPDWGIHGRTGGRADSGPGLRFGELPVRCPGAVARPGKEVRVYGATEAGLPIGFPSVRPHQVLGLEINEYAQQLAQVAVWIGYLQWMIGNGFTGISEPVFRRSQAC